MFLGLPVRLHHGSSSRNAGTRWPRATLGDLSLFQSSISHQTDAAVIRGMERTMDVMGGMAHRARRGPGARPSSFGLAIGGGRVIGYPLSSFMEADPDGGVTSPPRGWILEDTNVGDCGPTTSKEEEGMDDLSKPPRRPETRPSTFAGEPGPLEGQTIRQRSNTDIRRKPVQPQALPSGIGSKPIPTDSGSELFVPIDQIRMLPDAEAVARIMAAVNIRTLRSSRQYAMIPEYQKDCASRRRATYRDDLEYRVGSDVGALPDVMDHPAFAHETVVQEGMQSLWLMPPLPHTKLGPARASKGGRIFHPIGRLISCKDISVAEHGVVGAKNVPRSTKAGFQVTKSTPSVPQSSSYESKHTTRLEMLQQRRQHADRPDFRDSNIEYPNEEELKAIQNDIRARTMKGWMKQERRGTWYGYGLGV